MHSRNFFRISSAIWLLLILAQLHPSIASAPRGALLSKSPKAIPASKANKPASGASTTALGQLQKNLLSTIAQTKSTHISAYVIDQDSGAVLFAYNENVPVPPASNLKLYTTAAALDRLGAHFQTRTSVYAAALPDASGVLGGDLILYGRGDPNISARFYDGDYTKVLKDLAAQIAGRGVKQIQGNIVGDSSYFSGPNVGDGRTADDMLWYYGAKISALSVDENSVDLFVAPGARPGQPAQITFGPQTNQTSAINQTKTASNRSRTAIKIQKGPTDNSYIVSGSIAANSQPITYHMAVTDPTFFAATLFKMALEQQGIAVSGQPTTADYASRGNQTLNINNQTELAAVTSDNLAQEVQIINKESNNLHAELLMRQLGSKSLVSLATPANGMNAVAALQPQQTTDQAGIAAIRDFLSKAGVDSPKIVILDGSGLSENDRVTTQSTVALLKYVANQPYASIYLSSLPLAAADGTLRKRFVGTPAAGKVIAKTGNIDQADDLSGFINTASGRHLIFSFTATHPRGANATAALDALCVLFAQF